MARDISPKCKQCRRAGEKLYLKGERCNTPKCAMVKRNYPPGLHGPKGQPRMTGYGQQLSEKQKAKRQYHLLEKQFRLTFERAKSKGGNTGDNFIKLLEMRLDNVVYRLGLGNSRPAARQMVNHGLITVNGRTVTIPSYTVKIGDTIKIKSNKKGAKVFTDLEDKLKQHEVPGWLNFDLKEVKAKVLHQPDLNIMKPNFDVQMIIEYYSR